ncbi:MAG: YggT family protein [Patescibacteria group bacterium]
MVDVMLEQEPTTPKAYAKKKFIFRTYQLIWFVLGVIEVLLAFRVVLLALGANAQAGFANFIYSVSDPFALPFRDLFRVTVQDAYVFEWTTFIAMAVYAVLAYGLVELFQLIKPTNPEEVERETQS